MKLKSLIVASCLVTASFPLVANADALEDIKAVGKIRVATDMSIPPFGFLDEALQPIGSDVEAAKLLADHLGVKLEFIPTTGPTRIPNLQTGKADIIVSSLSVTPQRAEVVDFSKPYAAVFSVVAGPKDVSVTEWKDTDGKTIYVTRSTVQDSELTSLAKNHGFKVARYDDDATLITAAVSGQAGLVSTGNVIVAQIAKKNPVMGFEPKIVVRTYDVAVGVRKGEEALVNEINNWIAGDMKNGKLPAIFKKYHGLDLPEKVVSH